MFFSKHGYKNYLNVLVELWPNPGLAWALSVKAGLNVLNIDSWPPFFVQSITLFYR